MTHRVLNRVFSLLNDALLFLTVSNYFQHDVAIYPAERVVFHIVSAGFYYIRSHDGCCFVVFLRTQMGGQFVSLVLVQCVKRLSNNLNQNERTLNKHQSTTKSIRLFWFNLIWSDLNKKSIQRKLRSTGKEAPRPMTTSNVSERRNFGRSGDVCNLRCIQCILYLYSYIMLHINEC